MDDFCKRFFGIIWLVTGLLTVAIPLAFRSMKVSDFNKLHDMYNWDAYNNPQYYQQEYNGEQQYNNANNGMNYYRTKWAQMRESGMFDKSECPWWKINCFEYYMDENGEPEVGAGWYPSWYSGWSVTEEQREEMLAEGITSPSKVFVYVWQILMFLVILGYGWVVIQNHRKGSGLMIALALFANMSFLSMWWLADGSIVTDTEYVQQTGFYGQFAVLMFITNAWYVLFGIVYTGVFLFRKKVMDEESEKEERREKLQKEYEQDATYQAPTASTEPGWVTVE